MHILSSQTEWDRNIWYDGTPPPLPSLSIFVLNAKPDLTVEKWYLHQPLYAPCWRWQTAALQHTVEEIVLTNFQRTASTAFLTRYLSFDLLSGLGFFFPFSWMLCYFFYHPFLPEAGGAAEQHCSVDESRSVWKVLPEVLLLAMFLCPAMSLLASPEKT